MLTRTNYQLDDIGGALTWSSLDSFIKNLKSDSATARDLGKATGWEDILKTNAILADIYDILGVICGVLVFMATRGKKKPKITPYPRPGKNEDKNKRKIGKGAMPASELLAWFRRERNG